MAVLKKTKVKRMKFTTRYTALKAKAGACIIDCAQEAIVPYTVDFACKMGVRYLYETPH